MALLVMMPEAQAAATKLGDVLNNTSRSFVNFPNILSAFAYMSGLYFAITGVFHFKDHVDSAGAAGRASVPLSSAVKRFLAGGAMLSGPYMVEVLKGTLFGAGAPMLTAGGGNVAPTGGGMDQMIYDLVANAAGPMSGLLNVFTYISAIIFLLVGISRLTKTAQDGPRGPAGLGTIMTFLVSGALFSAGSMMGTFSSSLFGSATVSTFAEISPTIISNGGDRDKIEAVIEALMAFIMIVGFIAFIRGWFVLRAFADGGSQNATLAQALTFLFGGALAINLGALINVLGTTVGVSGITFGT